ncbi:ENDD1 protein, partial [Copsychus sechellarum]|nr:ENDD1 protein [Copsychus sechellarum]
MLGLLLLQVLASCLCLGHSKVVENFKNVCTQFFYAKTAPDFGRYPQKAARICQYYENDYRFATLYDRNRRIPLYSAYIYNPGNGTRSPSWFVEPQLINKSYIDSMDEESSIIQMYHINLTIIGKNQAIDNDYKNLNNLDRGHLNPSGHQPDNQSSWATFTLTNIVPQNRPLNQNAWRNYEETTMSQRTRDCDITYVLTGAVPGNTTVPSGRVNIPSHIWSAACCLQNKKPKSAWGAIAKNDQD